MYKSNVYEEVKEGLDVDLDKVKEKGIEGYEDFKKDLMVKTTEIVYYISCSVNVGGEWLLCKDEKLTELVFYVMKVLSDGVNSFEYANFNDRRGIHVNFDFLYRVCIFIERYIKEGMGMYFNKVLGNVGEIKDMLVGKGELREGY